MSAGCIKVGNYIFSPFPDRANDGKFDEGTNLAVESLTDAEVVAAVNADDLRSGLKGTKLFPGRWLGTEEYDDEDYVS